MRRTHVEGESFIILVPETFLLYNDNVEDKLDFRGNGGCSSAIPKMAAIFGQANMSWYEHWPLLKWALLTGFKFNFILVHKLKH
jgi:hypothetical protein